MEIYIVCFAGLLSILVLAAVYLADRYEPEPIDLIQSTFLTGLAAQLVLILAASLAAGPVTWSGPWLLVTLVGAALYLPVHLHRQPELDERFDGIVYSVAFTGGAVCAIHLNNLPAVVAASPFAEALAGGAKPDLRDLLILAGSGGFNAELGQGVLVVSVAVVFGAALGIFQMRGTPPIRTAAVCAVIAAGAGGLDLLVGGGWTIPAAMAAAAIGIAVALKRRSVFRGRPQPAESEALVLGVKTVLMVLGAALVAMVLLQVVADAPDSIEQRQPVSESWRGSS